MRANLIGFLASSCLFPSWGYFELDFFLKEEYPTLDGATKG